jgi:16S rRNA (uracil1498-N3)-methyltransferase
VARLLQEADVALVLHESATMPLREVFVPGQGHVVLVVGPEGGITEAEIGVFTRAGGRAVVLGETVLRSVTAGTVAAALVMSAAGRW